MGTWNQLKFHQAASINPRLTGLASQEVIQSLGYLPTLSAKADEGPRAQSRLSFLEPSCVHFTVHHYRIANHASNLSDDLDFPDNRFIVKAWIKAVWIKAVWIKAASI